MQKVLLMPNKYKKAQTLDLSQDWLGKKTGRKYILRKANKDFQHCFLPEHYSIKTGLHKEMGNGNLKAPGVTM